MNRVHNELSEGAHEGEHRTYNRLATVFFWPRMSRDVRHFVKTCDVCQKIKPRRHAPVGLLRSLPIPSRPFETISMDFIPELPKSGSFDNILVVVDKLTKYGIFVPTSTSITAADAAKLFFENVVAHYGPPKQVISDRDKVWSGEFWKHVTSFFGTQRLLATAYHPQTDGQTEILNQVLEIALRAYADEDLKDWASKLTKFSLSYNTAIHSATGYSPAFLLRGFHPYTPGNLMCPNENEAAILRDGEDGQRLRTRKNDDDAAPLHDEASEFLSEFESARLRAQEALRIAQAAQERLYNIQGRLIREFEEGDKVLINVHSLNLALKIEGRGKKLLARYEGPFEVIEKVSPVAYRLRFPTSYRGHPVLNIAHLEPYRDSPPEFGERPSLRLSRKNFDELPEVGIERIIDSKYVKRGKKKVKMYKVRWEGSDETHDEWKTRQGLRSAS